MTSFRQQTTAVPLFEELHVLPLKEQTGSNAGSMAVLELVGKK